MEIIEFLKQNLSEVITLALPLICIIVIIVLVKSIIARKRRKNNRKSDNLERILNYNLTQIYEGMKRREVERLFQGFKREINTKDKIRYSYYFIIDSKTKEGKHIDFNFSNNRLVNYKIRNRNIDMS